MFAFFLKHLFYDCVGTVVKTLRYPALLILGFLLLLSFATDQDHWKKDFDDGELVIYTRNHSDGIKEFKGTIVLNTTLKNCVGLLYDVARHKDFMYGVGTGKVVDEESEVKRYLHYIVEMPWPLDDRDIVSLVSTTQDPETKTVQMVTKSTPSKIPETELDRMERAEGLWQFRPIGEKQVEVTYQYLSDPEGIPTWVVNMFLLTAPKNTLFGLKEMVSKVDYSNAEFDWLKE